MRMRFGVFLFALLASAGAHSQAGKANPPVLQEQQLRQDELLESLTQLGCSQKGSAESCPTIPGWLNCIQLTQAKRLKGISSCPTTPENERRFENADAILRGDKCVYFVGRTGEYVCPDHYSWAVCDDFRSIQTVLSCRLATK